jgi:hypothetical protein
MDVFYTLMNNLCAATQLQLQFDLRFYNPMRRCGGDRILQPGFLCAANLDDAINSQSGTTVNDAYLKGSPVWIG